MSSKNIAVILMTDPEHAQELANQLAEHNVDALLPESSDVCHHMLNHQRVDLVIMEQDIRGFLTGLEILERMNSELLRPATVLVGNLSEKERERARVLGINSVLKRGTPIETVATTAHGLLTTAQVSQAVIPSEARKLVQGADVVRPLPHVLIKLSGYLDSDTLSMADLANDISVDPRITAELMKLTNSSTFALNRKLTKVSDAISLLGIRRTISLVLSAGLMGAQSGILKTWPIALRTWYQQRSVLIASTSAAFARNLEDVCADTAFILGLLQETGILILAHAHTQRYTQIVDRVRKTPQLRLEISERETYGTTHADVSAALLQKWELPQSLVSMVLHHHGGAASELRSDVEQRFLRLMQIGEAVANLSDNSCPQRHHVLNHLMDHYGPARIDVCRASLADAVAKTAEASRMFAIPEPDGVTLLALVERLNDGIPHSPAEHGLSPEICEDVPSRETAKSVPDSAPELVEKRPPTDSRVTDAPGLTQLLGRRVLLIEDDEEIVKLVTRMLESLDIEVLSCKSLGDALRLLSDVSIVLCDVHLGAENGIDVTFGLRRHGYDGPVIIVSGDRTRNTVESCIKIGVAGYLIKPFSRKDVLQTIRKHTALLSEQAAPVLRDEAGCPA